MLHDWALKSLAVPLRPKLTKEEKERLRKVLEMKTLKKHKVKNDYSVVVLNEACHPEPNPKVQG